MRISINSIRGATSYDLDNINGLNHYIGLQRISPEAIPELRLMPWILGALIVTGLIAALLRRRRPLYAWFAAFVIASAAGLVDFWRWEYEYGHNIDFEHAIIKIPGMNYQPPLMGVKQLLNFTAVSWPDAGGWLALVAFALATLAVVTALRSATCKAANA
jgi:copper chaperone NosL